MATGTLKWRRATMRTDIPALALLLELRALTKSVPSGRVLFRDLSLNVQPGELVCIVNGIQGRIWSAPNRAEAV